MSIVTGKYESKPQPDPNIKPVEAIQLTADNIEQVAEWCNGEIIEVSFVDGEQPAIRLKTNCPPVSGPKMETANLTNWVTQDEDGFQVYDSGTFDITFQPASETDPNIQAIIEIGESVFQHVAIREAVWNAIHRSKKVFDSSSTAQRKEASLAIVAQMAISDIKKIFGVED